MAKTRGLGGAINSDSRSGEKWCGGSAERTRPAEKICRICGACWTPLTAAAAGKRDICYRPECEKTREAERRKRRKRKQAEWYKRKKRGG